MPKQRKNALAALDGVEVAGRLYEAHAYLNPDGSVDGEKLLNIIRQMPGGFELMMLSAVLEQMGDVASRYHEEASEIVEGIVNLIMLAAHGDEESEIHVTAIRKLVRSRIYEVPQDMIEKTSRYETRPPLARAWEIRRSMSHLCIVVEPQGRSVKMRDKALVSSFWGDLWEAANRHVKTNTTLTSLALHMYLEQLQAEGIVDENATISEESLKRDLRLARNWERTASEDEKLRRGKHKGLSLGDDEPIVWYQFSEGWKTRKLAGRSRKKSAARGGGYKDRNKLS